MNSGYFFVDFGSLPCLSRGYIIELVGLSSSRVVGSLQFIARWEGLGIYVAAM